MRTQSVQRPSHVSTKPVSPAPLLPDLYLFLSTYIYLDILQYMPRTLAYKIHFSYSTVTVASLSRTYTPRCVFHSWFFFLFFLSSSPSEILLKHRLCFTPSHSHEHSRLNIPPSSCSCGCTCLYRGVYLKKKIGMFLCFVSREIGGEIDRWVEVKERARSSCIARG